MQPLVPGGTTYRGFNNARVSVNAVEGDTPVIADRNGNHGPAEDAAMNYVMKSGYVHRVRRNSSMWRERVASNVVD